MSINLYNIEQAILDKMNSSSTELELLEYSKMLEQIKTGVVHTVNTFASLPAYADSVGHMYYIKDENTVYWANATNGWLALTVQSLNALYIWGNATNGKLLNLSTSIAASSPRQEYTSATNWCSIADNYQSQHAVKCDGSLWSWGYNGAGQLAANLPSYVTCCTPRREYFSATNWCTVYGSSIAAILALKTDGTLWGWGSGQCGVLANGDVSNKVTPVQDITSSTTWSKISMYRYGSGGIKSDGTAWNWGQNNKGQAGINCTVPSNFSSPVQEYTSSTDWCTLKADGDFRLALKTDGTIWGWGCGWCGALGLGHTSPQEVSSPVQEVSSSTNWCTVSRSSGIKTDGTLWWWGFNSSGIGFQNNTINYSSPSQEITSSTNWCFLHASSAQTFGIKTDGTLWGGGVNTCGSLGDNTLTQRSSPVQEASSATNWCSVDAGGFIYYSTMALKSTTF